MLQAIRKSLFRRLSFRSYHSGYAVFLTGFRGRLAGITIVVPNLPRIMYGTGTAIHNRFLCVTSLAYQMFCYQQSLRNHSLPWVL